MYGGQTTHIPIKVNQAGVIPDDLRAVPPAVPAYYHITSLNPDNSAILHSLGDRSGCHRQATPGVWIYARIEYCADYVLHIFLYCHHFQSEWKLPDNMKANGGFIPGIRPGKSDRRISEQGYDKSHFCRELIFLAADRDAA